MVLVWENLRRFLWCWSSFCCCCSSFVVFLYFVVVLYPFPGYFTMSPTLNPGFSDPWRPPPALNSTPTTFENLFFFIYRVRYGFEWAFFTHRRFLPYAPSRHFGTTCFHQGFPWEPVVIPSNLLGFILILERQTLPICLFDSQ